MSITFYMASLSPMQPSSRVTIRDVAAHAGVSVATVSKVINERYGVSAATLAKVRAVIEELGYEASLVAQSLRNHRTNVIGILVADLEPFSTELLKGAADAIRGSGFELVVYSAGGRTGDPKGWEKRYLSRLSGTLVDGAVLVTPAVSLEAVPGTPVVAVDPHTGPSHLPTIDSDNLRGAQLATEHPDLAVPVSDSCPTLGAEMLFGVLHEGAMTVEDLVERRTRVSFDEAAVPAGRAMAARALEVADGLGAT